MRERYPSSLVIVGPYPPPHGGVEVHVARLHEFALGKGIRSSAINISRHRSTGHRNVYFPASGLGVMRLFFRLRPDVAHVHIGGDPSVRELLLCTFLGALPGVTAVVTFHSGGLPAAIAAASPFLRGLLGVAIRAVDGIVAVNRDIQLAVTKIRPEAVVTVIPPQSYGHIVGALERVRVLEGELGDFVRRSEPLLIVVGGLEPEYRVGLAIDALDRLVRALPEVGLLVLGAGSLRNDLYAQIERLGLQAHVMLAGDISHDATLRAIAESDAMLRVTTFDGDAISVREGLHLGTAVIATDNGMRPEGVILVPDATPESVADTVRRALARRPATSSAEAGDAHLDELLEFYDALRRRPNHAHRVATEPLTGAPTRPPGGGK